MDHKIFISFINNDDVSGAILEKCLDGNDYFTL